MYEFIRHKLSGNFKSLFKKIDLLQKCCFLVEQKKKLFALLESKQKSSEFLTSYLNIYKLGFYNGRKCGNFF
jgi:hypothetical protein